MFANHGSLMVPADTATPVNSVDLGVDGLTLPLPATTP